MDLWNGEALVDTPEVTEFLYEQLGREPSLAALTEIEYQPRTTNEIGMIFRAAWGPTGEPVVLKLNATAIELDWMLEVSQRAPGLVPQVYASAGVWATRTWVGSSCGGCPTTSTPAPTPTGAN